MGPLLRQVIDGRQLGVFGMRVQFGECDRARHG